MRNDFPEFPPFTEATDFHDPLFSEYKKAIGIKSDSVDLVHPERAEEVATFIIETANEVSQPYQGHLHNFREFRALYEVIRGYHDQKGFSQPSGHIVNCGTFRASNACLIATALRDANNTQPLITIDPFTYAHTETNVDDTTDLVFVHHKQLIEKLELQDLIVSVFFKDIEYMLEFWSSQPIRIAVIDTCHSYHQTAKEIKILTQYIPAGGWFISHDYMPRHLGVLQAIHEFLSTTTRRYQLLNAWAYLFIQFLS